MRIFKSLHAARSYGLRLVLSLGLMLSLTSCNNGCEETRETYLYASLKATSKAKITGLNLWTPTAQGDSLMLAINNPNAFELELCPDSSKLEVYILSKVTLNKQDSIYTDTLWVEYDSYPYFINMECGCSVYYDIKKINCTNHLFTEMEIKNQQITNEENVNIVLTY